MKQNFSDFIRKQNVLGYTKGNEILKLSKEEIEILRYLNKYTLNVNFILDYIYGDELRQVTKECLNNYFNLHKVKKPVNNSSFSSKGKIFGWQINKAWDRCLENIDPYSIPVEYYAGDSNLGYLLTTYPILNDKMNFKINNIGMVAIVLGNEITPLMISTYAHELMHTQLEDRRIYTNNYYNKEVLSKFVEFLVSYLLSNDKKYSYLNSRFISLYDMKKVSSMKFLKQDLNTLMHFEKRDSISDREYIDLVNISSYVNSTLIALELFDNYMNASSDSQRRKIIYSIQDVLDGKITIDEMLGCSEIGTVSCKKLEIVKRWVR